MHNKMRLSARLIILGIMLNYVIAVDYDAQVADQETRAINLEAEIQTLQEEIQALNIQTTDYKFKMIDLETFARGHNEEIGAKNQPFYNQLSLGFDEKMVAGNQECDQYFQEKTEEKYDYYFKKLIGRIENYTRDYDTRNEFIRNRLNTTDATLRGYLNQYTEIKESLEGTVNDILNNNLSNEEKLAKLALISDLQEGLYKISRQIQMDGFHEEEKQRTDGNSGIKQIRTGKAGSENYFANTHTGSSFASIHDHSNNILTVGMGEFIGVLNGVEFRTRHNDYQLRKPVTDDQTYHKVEPVTFPGIPQQVTDKPTIPEQIAEMREWFKAFKAQDYTERDYRPYFRPLLVYLEGAWTTGGDSIDEPFLSDRHNIDAKSWLDLQEKVRFTSYAGSKSLLENLAHLPTKIIRFTHDKEPVLAQWNYRLLCHPIEGDFALDNLKLVVDQTVLKRNQQSEEKYKKSRAPKFDIEGIDIDQVRQDHPMDYTFLDTIMEQIPGKDNYNAPPIEPLVESNGEMLALYSANPDKVDTKLNAAYYHRAFLQKDSTGKEVRDQRGFSDRMWVAHTNQKKIAQVSYNTTIDGTMRQISNRVTYAVPVEIIWLTPLNGWNPYNIPNVQGSLTGDGDLTNPFNGYDNRNYFLTPSSFFSGDEGNPDPADTIKKGNYAVNVSGEIKLVRASGTRILFPEIEGVERLRQRYPVMPIHGEGSAVWKKLNAVEDAIKIKNSIHSQTKYFATGQSHSIDTTSHQHIVEIGIEDYNRLIQHKVSTLTISTLTANGHFHELTIGVDGAGAIYISTCDGSQPDDPVNHPDQLCFDYHENTLESS